VAGQTDSFSYPFRGPSWAGRVVVGGVLELVPLVVVLPVVAPLLRDHDVPPLAGLRLMPLAVILGLAARLVVLGYLRRVALGVLRGTDTGLPAWDRFGEDLVEGFKLAVALILLWLPAVAVVVGLTLVVTALATPQMAWLPILLAAPPAALLTLGYLPAALLAIIDEGELSAAFDIDRVGRRIAGAFGPYLLAFVIAATAEIVAQFGLLLCCVGIFATRFAAHCVAVHAFATAHRDATAPPAPVGSTPG
jgi:hypothetical protein